MTTVLLIRHAHHELGGGVIAGRLPNVHLSEEGRRQAASMAKRLESHSIAALYSSPMERTLETAQYVADRVQVEVEVEPSLIEIDFGDWMGKPVSELRPREEFKRFNEFRSGSPAANGEWMLDIQSRIVRFMLGLRDKHPGQYVALFSHGDVIKSAVAYCLGVPLDLFQRIEISPASISTIGLGEYGPFVLCINETGGIPPYPW